MFIQNTTPNQIATWRGFNSPNTPSSSTGSFRTIGRKTGMMSSTMPTQSMNMPMIRKMNIMTRMIDMVGSSAARIMLAT